MDTLEKKAAWRRRRKVTVAFIDAGGETNTETARKTSNKTSRRSQEPFPPLPSINAAGRGQDQQETSGVKVNIPTQNRYEALTDTDEDSASDMEVTNNNGNPSKKRKVNQKKKPPPPVVLHKCYEHKEIKEFLDKNTQEGYAIKYTKQGPSIHTNTEEDRQTIIKELQNKSIKFHTYADKNQKRKTYVLYGLCKGTTEDIIEAELKQKLNTAEVKVNKMKTAGMPLYMVTVNPEITRPTDIQKIRGLDNTIIRWEYYITDKRITQCRRCQEWGHGTSHCYDEYKCMKCAENHPTNECKKDEKEPAKCANCKQGHPANSKQCPKYIERKEWLANKEERKPKNETHERRNTYVPAPIPRTNPWTSNINNTQQNKETQNTPTPKTINQNTTPQRTDNTASGMGGMQELQNEIRTLNSLINVRKLIDTIKKLNHLLLQAQPSERFLIAVEFLANLNEP